MKILIQFERGVARCLWTDAVPLAELGTLHVERASSVEFNNYAQGWTVKFSGERTTYGPFLSRQSALDWERQELDRRMLTQ